MMRGKSINRIEVIILQITLVYGMYLQGSGSSVYVYMFICMDICYIYMYKDMYTVYFHFYTYLFTRLM